MDNGVESSASRRAGRGRRGTADAVGAIALAEGATAQRIFVADAYEHFSVAPHNAFGDPVAQSSGADVLAQALQCEQYAERGERVALVAPARELAAARLAMQSIAAKRLGVVFHAIADRGVADVMALADTGWGLLFASSVEDSLDLTLIARRAAEDCGTPFVVAHEVSLIKHIEPVTSPDASLCEAFVGPPSARVRRLVDPAHPMHTKVGERAFAERVPFALGSAMRELESLTGRRHDAFERSGGNDAPVMLVGLGALGDALEGEVERLRHGGHDVGAVKLTSFRPFPGPRLVRVLMRALVVTVLEGSDTPLAQSNPLTRELKAAFADALTWAPEYPGVGRIPRIHSGVVGAGDHELEAHELIAIVQNMIEGDHGKRLFVLGADPELSLPPIGERPHDARFVGDFAMRGRAQDEPTAQAAAELCAAVVSSALALKARASVRALTVADGGGFAFDLAAARERPRGVAKPPHARLIVLDDIGSLIRGNPLARLSRGGIIAVPTLQRSADALWSEMPPYVKAIAFDREARVVGFAPEAGQDPEQARWFLAAAYAGVALAVLSVPAPLGRAAIDASLVAREVGELLKTLGGADAGTCERGAAVARKAFEANIEVPRATIERDEESVRLGRRDTRATVSR